MINIKNFDSSLLKIDWKLYKNIGIYNIGYITIKKIDDYENIYSANPLYLMISEVIGRIEHISVECNSIEKKNNGNKYLFSEKKEVLKKYKEVWDGIKNKIENINAGGCNSVECKYGKDFTKIKFDADDDLPLNKPLNLHMLTVILRSVFEDECLYELHINAGIL